MAQQLPLLKEPIDYNYFAGREAFEEMRKYIAVYSKGATNQALTSK